MVQYGNSQDMKLSDVDGLSQTLSAGHFNQPKIAQFQERKADGVGRLMPVHRTQRGGIRRLTPMECERLQAFPDNWTRVGLRSDGTEHGISDTQRYKQCGNAVTTNVIEAVSRLLPTEA